MNGSPVLWCVSLVCDQLSTGLDNDRQRVEMVLKTATPVGHNAANGIRPTRIHPVPGLRNAVVYANAPEIFACSWLH